MFPCLSQCIRTDSKLQSSNFVGRAFGNKGLITQKKCICMHLQFSRYRGEPLEESVRQVVESLVFLSCPRRLGNKGLIIPKHQFSMHSQFSKYRAETL